MRKLVLIVILALTTCFAYPQIYTDEGYVYEGWVFIQLDNYKSNGLKEGYRGLVDMGVWPDTWGSIYDNDLRTARFITPKELIEFMEDHNFEWRGTETYVLRKIKTKDVWTTVWIFYKKKE